MRWNLVVPRNSVIGAPILLKVVRQHPMVADYRDDLGLHDPRCLQYLTVHEHLKILQKSANKFLTERDVNTNRRLYPYFKGVSVTLTTPRSAHLYRSEIRQFMRLPCNSPHPTQKQYAVSHSGHDNFPVPMGLSFFSLEAFLDTVVDLHNTADFKGLIGGFDFVGPERDGRPFASIYQLLLRYARDLLGSPGRLVRFPVPAHFHGHEFAPATSVASPAPEYMHNMEWIIQAHVLDLVRVTRIGHGYFFLVPPAPLMFRAVMPAIRSNCKSLRRMAFILKARSSPIEFARSGRSSTYPTLAKNSPSRIMSVRE
jgi:hypothetical protein